MNVYEVLQMQMQHMPLQVREVYGKMLDEAWETWLEAQRQRAVEKIARAFPPPRSP